MFKEIFVILFMMFSVKAYAGTDDLLHLDYDIITSHEVQKVISNGAVVNIRNKDGLTPLMLAVIKNNPDVVKVLVDAGADMNVQVKKVFVGDWADLLMQTKNGWTALMFAVDENNLDMVKVLVDAGADVNVQDTDSYTALTIAQDNGYTDIIKILKSAGADVNVQDTDSYTALTIAQVKLIAQVKGKLVGCWDIPAGVPNARNLSVTVNVKYAPDGSVTAVQVVKTSRSRDTQGMQPMVDSVIRAVKKPACNPIGLDSNSYDLWKEVLIEFDPRAIL